MEVKYSADGKTAFYDGYKFRKDQKSGYYLCSKKTDIGKRERLHNYVWRSINGEVPNGFNVHHIDQDKDNNDITNLQLLSVHDHQVLHGELKTPDERMKLRDNLLENAMPKAVEWHGSIAGKEWHAKHSKEVWRKRQAREYECTNCGTIFTTLNIYGEKINRFCSNKCKSAYRRKQGVDDIERECEQCGNTFTTNKYSKTKYCKQCRCHQHRKNRQ